MFPRLGLSSLLLGPSLLGRILAADAVPHSLFRDAVAGLYTRVARPQPDLHLHELALKANIPIQTVQHMWKRFVEIDVSRDSGDGLTGDRRIALEELEPLLAEAGIQDKVLRKALFDAFDADRFE
jgi:hypothetical protein